MASERSPDETLEGQKPGEVPSTERQPDSDSSSLRHQTFSPERVESTHKSKKPTMSRRGSSQHSRHRGQDFSVDDDPLEFERDMAQRQASGRGSVRRMPSGLRRRGTAQPTPLPRVESNDEGEVAAEAGEEQEQANISDGEGTDNEDTNGQTTLRPEDEGASTPEDEEYLSDAESFTLKDKQDAINKTHPFGVRIWKPALYKKSRSVQQTAEGDIHSSPGGRVSNWLFMFNVLWTIFFGWWLAVTAALGAIVCFIFGFTSSSVEYGRVLFGLARYLLYPFGKFVRLEQDEAYAEEDRGEGRSISEYEQWQSGDLEDGRLFFGPVSTRSIIGARRNSLDSASETDSLLGRSRRDGVSETGGTRNKRRLFGRGDWNIGRIIFFVFFYFLITPSLFLVSGICWLMVFWIPMAKVTLLLFRHLRRHPLALSFHSDSAYSRGPGSPSSSILMCTYRAVGLKYWKYTVDGTNIFLINLIGVVLFVIFDYWVLDVALGMKFFLTHPAFIFLLSLFSIIPLAYFIGQAVASISAQSSMGLGAAINAFFSTIVEVFLYCVALKEGKGQLVEGSVIGSIFAGILFLPGLSMCCGAIKRKTQRFNAKSAGVTSTMLLFAVIAAFGPTLFYQIYGTVRGSRFRRLVY
jgi:Ca2+:H+ antiporter